MAHAENTDLVERFEQFYRRYYADEIAALANAYPQDQRSLFVDFEDIERFDPDLADDFRSRPTQFTEHAEEALRRYDLPVDVSLGRAHVRVRNLRSTTDIRAIRSEDIGNLIAVSGIVRKSTEVRPKVEVAAFECQRCGTMTRIDQPGGNFQDPHECAGCERQGPFQISFDQSEFVDSQQLRVQERPEGLRGGETPESIDIHVEDDATGRVTPGDYVTVVGVLHLDQSRDDRETSPVFDVYMEGISIEIEDEEFEEMDITDADKQRIVELSERETIYDDIVASIAPSIYGFELTKLAMALQLFSGVTKHLPDGSRTRGDLHILLIGDPGTGKCVAGDTRVRLSDGTAPEIRDLVEANLEDPTAVDDGVYDEVNIDVPTILDDGTVSTGTATRVWKRDAPETMFRIHTSTGRELEVTPSHPLYELSENSIEHVPAANLDTGQFVAVPTRVSAGVRREIDIDYRQSEANNAVRLDLPEEWTPSLARLIGYIVAEGHVVLREDHTGDVRVTNNDPEILDDVEDAYEQLGLPYTRDDGRSSKSAKTVRCTSGEFAAFLSALDERLLERSAELRIPAAIQRAPLDIKTAFLKAYIEGECHVSATQRELSVASMSEGLLFDVRSMLESIDISSQLAPRQNGSYRLRISGTDFERYISDVGFVTDRKAEAAAEQAGVSANTNIDVVPVDGETLRNTRRTLGLSQSDCGLARSTYQHYERGDRNPSSDHLKTVVRSFQDRLSWLEDAKDRVTSQGWDAIEELREDLNLSQRDLARHMDVTQTAVSYYERTDAIPDGGSVSSATQVTLDRIDDSLRARPAVEQLSNVCESDLRWEEIQSIEGYAPDEESVYDLEVSDTHNYVSNGLLSHNSQLLQYVQNISPRSVYTSGKGSSSAGLTAAAVRDDFGDGGEWSLEAGALVLADRGIAAIDELDKMRSEDQSAMHEALEQQSYHPNFELSLADGRSERIGALVDDAIERNPDDVVAGIDCEILPVDDLAVRSADLDEDELTTLPIDRVSRHEAPDRFIRVSFSNGNAVTVTPEHPMFVEQDGGLETVPAVSLETGTSVPAPTDRSAGEHDERSPARSRAVLSDIQLERVTDVETIPNEGEFATDWVYDVTVEPTNTFVSAGVVLHNSISVSKAGINATLKSRCSLLGAANPTYGRFDQYEPIGEQIDLDPPLISRFDLIFTVTDQPNEEEDRRLAEHIIKTNYAGELNTHREQMARSNVTEAEVEAVVEDVAPEIEPELLQKYVAYARRHCFPTMSDAAMEAIQEFYVDLRMEGQAEDAPVPVTARKLEALVRLAEASARVRLSDEVTEADAERVIEIVRSCLRDIGVDPETGNFDADVIETGTSKTQRDRKKSLTDIVAELEDEYEEGAPIEEVVARAGEAGIEAEKAEDELETLTTRGELYRPTNDHVRTI